MNKYKKLILKERKIQKALDLMVIYIKEFIYYYLLDECYYCSDELENLFFIMRPENNEIIIDFPNYNLNKKISYEAFEENYNNYGTEHIRYFSIIMINQEYLVLWGLKNTEKLEEFEEVFYNKKGCKILEQNE